MGVDEDPGSFPFGSQPNHELMMQKISFNNMFDESYPKFKGKKFWGNYGTFGAPQLVINDPELMKDILIKVLTHALRLLAIITCKLQVDHKRPR